jgi:hypothetical protein
MAELAVSAVAGCDGASLSVLESDGQVSTAGASDERTVQLDKLQYHSQQGPCLSAIRTATVLRVDDFGRDSRYPTFGPNQRQPCWGVRRLWSQAGRSQRSGARQVAVDFAGDATLEHAHDLELGASLLGAALHEGAHRWVRVHLQ